MLPAVRPILPMMAWNFTTGDFEMWEIGNLAPQYFVSSASIDFSGNKPVDPMASPNIDAFGTPPEFVYSIIGLAGGFINTVQRVTWEDAANVQIASAPNSAVGTGRSQTLMPAFSPDGSEVVYIYSSSSIASPTTVGLKINKVNRDGTGDTTLYDSGAGVWYLFNPLFSPDGQYIAFVSAETYLPTPITTARKYRIEVMEADGSNRTTIVGPLNGGSTDVFPLLYDTVSWMHDSNVLCYLQQAATATADWEWHRIDFDGSNDTNLHTISRAGFTSGDVDPGPIYSSWLTDDSGIVTSLLDIGTGDHELSVIDAAGGGVTGLGVIFSYGGFAGTMMRPLVYQERIYFPEDNVLKIVQSTLEDGSGIRTEFDGTADNILFMGFRGDPT